MVQLIVKQNMETLVSTVHNTFPPIEKTALNCKPAMRVSPTFAPHTGIASSGAGFGLIFQRHVINEINECQRVGLVHLDSPRLNASIYNMAIFIIIYTYCNIIKM